MRDNITTHAAAISFYIILYFIPFSLLIIALSSVFIDVRADSIAALFKKVQAFIPGFQFQTLLGDIKKLTMEKEIIGFFGVIILIFLSSKIFIIIQKSINVSFNLHYSSRFIYDYVMSIVFVLLLSVLYFIFSGIAPLIRIINGMMGGVGLNQSWAGYFTSFFSLVLSFLIGISFLFSLYYFIPRKKVLIRAAFLGASISAFFWLLGRYIFGFYLAKIADYSAIYGAYGIIVLFLLWVFFTSYTIVFGAELASLVQYNHEEREKGSTESRLLKHIKKIKKNENQEQP
ncbi:MAG: YihY/virulence factor BrkB family protein [Spirochaetes bacterium]|nr:YihY/virulence factor BrkB family protein [Spirochaetota bacterium]